MLRRCHNTQHTSAHVLALKLNGFERISQLNRSGGNCWWVVDCWTRGCSQSAVAKRFSPEREAFRTEPGHRLGGRVRKKAFVVFREPEVRVGKRAVCHRYQAVNTASVLTGSFRLAELGHVKT